jgi:DNA-binding LacI/PurR family transcriptional regulator
MNDIAEALNISKSTVSRALRNKPGVNPRLREEIFKMAQDLNYPFKLPKHQEFNRVGIIIPDFSNAFFSTVCYGIQSVFRANGYLAYVVSTDEDWELERDYVHFLVREEVEGLIIAPTRNTEKIYKDLNSVPMVFFDRHPDSLNVQSVLVDNKDIMFQALRYLVEVGHKNICFVSGDDLLYTGRLRTAGFLEALDILGLSRDGCPVITGNFKEPEAYEATRNAFQAHKVTAVIASSNKTTLGVLRALRDLELSIPEDVSVIGFDDQEWMEFNTPPITTIVQPAFTMGTLAASLLLQQIQGNSSPESVVLKAEIKHRHSVRSIP